MALQNPIGVQGPTVAVASSNAGALPTQTGDYIVGGAHKYTVTATDLAGLGAFTSGDIILTNLPAGAIVRWTRVKHRTAVSGGAISASTARVITANNNYGSGTLDVFAAVGTTNGTHLITDITGASENVATTTPLLLHMTSTGANLSAVTAGVIDVWVDYDVAA